MSGLWLLVVALAALAALVGAGLGDMVSSEVRARLDQVPQAIAVLAVRRLPGELRVELADEWFAELHEILRGAEAVPVTRLVVGCRFAVGLVRASRTVGRELQSRPLAGLGDAGGHRPVPRQLPEPVLGFVGRAGELSSIVGEARRTVTVISGPGGIGKTVLAVLAARRLAERFPDGQIYVNLCGSGPAEPVSAQQALRGFLTALGCDEAALPAGLEACQKLYRTMIADKSMLIVLDDAASAAHARPLLPHTRTCRVLITSRAPLSDLVARDRAARLNLGMLSNPDAMKIWQSILEGVRDDPDEDVAALVEACGHLPLAVCLAAGHARIRPDRPLPELMRALRGGDRGDDALSVAIHVAVTGVYEALPPLARRMFRLLGRRPLCDIDVQEAAALAGVDVRCAADLLHALAIRHLIDEAPSRGSYRMREIVHRYAESLPEVVE